MTSVIPSRASDPAHLGVGSPPSELSVERRRSVCRAKRREQPRQSRSLSGGLRGSPPSLLGAHREDGVGVGEAVAGGWGSGRLCPEKGRGLKRADLFFNIRNGALLILPAGYIYIPTCPLLYK